MRCVNEALARESLVSQENGGVNPVEEYTKGTELDENCFISVFIHNTKDFCNNSSLYT